MKKFYEKIKSAQPLIWSLVYERKPSIIKENNCYYKHLSLFITDKILESGWSFYSVSCPIWGLIRACVARVDVPQLTEIRQANLEDHALRN